MLTSTRSPWASPPSTSTGTEPLRGPRGRGDGELRQAGSYKIDARFDKHVLRGRIEKLAELNGKIRVTRQDGAARLREYLPKDNVFAYVDPPYVEKGSSLT